MSIHARLGLRTLSHIRLPPALPSCSCRRALMYSTSHSAQPTPGPSKASSSSTTDSFVIPDQPPTSKTSPTSIPSDAASPQVAAKPPQPPRVERARPKIRAAKAAITMTPAAVERIRAMLHGPSPQLIRIGVRNKGCAGLSYHLEYVEKPGKFDEVVEQNGVRVLIDSKALFSIIGSEMDWVEDNLSSKFAFNNPNIKDACGCGESFTV